MTEPPQVKFKDLPWDDKRSFTFNIWEAEKRAYNGDVQSAVLYFADALKYIDKRVSKIESLLSELEKALIDR